MPHPAAPDPSPLDRAGYFRRWADLHGGYDPAAHPPARLWLGMVYAVARRGGRVAPTAVTGAGLLVASGAPVLAWGGLPVLAAVAVLASGFLDSLDGAVAVVHGRESRVGFVLDSVADRISDSAYVVAFWVLGAPGWLCVLAAGTCALQEYVRARAAATGMPEIGVVTVFERPTRVIVAALVLTAYAVPQPAIEVTALVGAAGWLVLAVVGCGQLLGTVHRRLR